MKISCFINIVNTGGGTLYKGKPPSFNYSVRLRKQESHICFHLFVILYIRPTWLIFIYILYCALQFFFLNILIICNIVIIKMATNFILLIFWMVISSSLSSSWSSSINSLFTARSAKSVDVSISIHYVFILIKFT